MEMKLSGTRIKELRLKLSWSQEKLAEQAGLNPRTVQRAEAEGTASLRTRLQLAQALQVRPEALDAERGCQTIAPGGFSGMSVHHLTLLILVSIVYLAAQPAFFSLSITNFSWINYGLGSYLPWPTNPALWVMNLVVWASLALPILLRLYRKQRELFRAYTIAFSLGLCMSVLRIWQPAWVAEAMTALLSLSGLALLLSLYTSRLDMALIRHGAYMCLGAYVFIWLFHGFVYFTASLYARLPLVALGADPVSPLDPIRYLAHTFPGRIAALAQVIPLLLVIALSWGRQSAANKRADKAEPDSAQALSAN